MLSKIIDKYYIKRLNSIYESIKEIDAVKDEAYETIDDCNKQIAKLEEDVINTEKDWSILQKWLRKNKDVRTK